MIWYPHWWSDKKEKDKKNIMRLAIIYGDINIENDSYDINILSEFLVSSKNNEKFKELIDKKHIILKQINKLSEICCRDGNAEAYNILLNKYYNYKDTHIEKNIIYIAKNDDINFIKNTKIGNKYIIELFKECCNNNSYKIIDFIIDKIDCNNIIEECRTSMITNYDMFMHLIKYIKSYETIIETSIWLDNDKILEYLIFTLKLIINPDKRRHNYEKIKNMTSKRDLQEKLLKELKETTTTTKRNKI